MKVLITGAAGAIGNVLREGLQSNFSLLRLTDRTDIQSSRGSEEVIKADLTEFDTVCNLVEGMDAIVHLAGSLGVVRESGRIVGETSWTEILDNNIKATYNVFEAARLCSVPRVVYASSIHAHGFYLRSHTVGVNDPPRPDSRYGLSKAFGESTGRLYADKHGLQVVVLRIATFKSRPTNVRELGTWISHRDMTELVKCSLNYPNPHFDILWGVSANSRGIYQNPLAEKYKFFPQDNSEIYAKEILTDNLQTPESPLESRFHAAHQASTGWSGNIDLID